MTQRLYYEDSYRTQFEARLDEVLPLPDGRLALFLDATCFYPTGGGQLHDLGRLAGVEVEEVLEHERGIAHLVRQRPAFAAGAVVVGEVDANRRRQHRQQHSGQHILSRALEELFDLPTDSARLGDHANSIDLKSSTIEAGAFERVIARANEIVWEARPVRVQMIEATQADSDTLRKKSERSGIVRVIEVEGYDRCPCGGTHVQNSGEIGLIAPLRQEGIARGVRIHFLCGERALDHLRRRDHTLSDLALRCTSNAEDLAARFEKLSEENKGLRRELGELAAASMRQRAEVWRQEAIRVRCAGRVLRHVRQELPESAAERIQSALPVLLAEADLLAVLFLRGEERVQILVCAGRDCGVDCAALLNEWLQGLGKGGGRADQARGSVGCSDFETVRARIDQMLAVPL